MALIDDFGSIADEAAQQLRGLMGDGLDKLYGSVAERDRAKRAGGSLGSRIGAVDYEGFVDNANAFPDYSGRGQQSFGSYGGGGQVFDAYGKPAQPFTFENVSRGAFGNYGSSGVDINDLYGRIGAEADATRQRIAQRQQAAQQTADTSNFSYNGPGDPMKARGIDGAMRWKTLVDRAAAETGVPWQVIMATMALESGGDPNADHAGIAVGLMAVVPYYWPELIQKFGDPTDPWNNIRIGAEILKQKYQQYGTWEQAALAYFGALNADGTINTEAKDVAFGTTGQQYLEQWQNNLAALNYGTGGSSGNQRTDSAIAFAKQMIGQPYVWGGESLAEGGFDCSGLVQWAFAQAGVALPRTSQNQWNAVQHIDGSQARAGDLIFFSIPGANPEQPGVVNHVAIYLGNGMMLEAPSEGKQVRVWAVDEWYQQYVVGYGRVPMGGDLTGKHTGIDAPSRKGARVNAIRPGQVIGVGHDPDVGYHAVLFDGHNLYTYGHLDPEHTRVNEGDWIDRNGTIGYVGLSGKTTGPHVHLDIHDLDGQPVQNPFAYL